MTTPELSRSTLEAKDKEQLATIAKAMGGKPTTRTKKDDIVDMILEMAGVDADGKPLGGAPAEEPDSDDGHEDAEANTADRNQKSGAQGRSDQAAEEDDDGEDTAKGKGKGGGKDRDGGRGNDNGRNNNDSRSGGRKGNAKADADADNDDDDEDDGDDDNDRGNDGSSDGSQNDANGAERRAEVEPGNRRRRRRGRGRDKDRDDEWFGDPTPAEGHLDLRDEGYAFLRVNDGRPSKQDVYVPVKLVRQFNLRRGDHVEGLSRPAARSEKNPAMMQIDRVNGSAADGDAARPNFDDLTPVFPTERITLGRPDSVTGRALDLLTPLAKGHRGLITAPPRSGKSAVVAEIVQSIEQNHPDMKLFVLLVEERPEEVTEMERLLEHASVVTSAFDRPADEHVAIAELLIDRAKRLVELGEDVVIVTDGFTRLARAYNAVVAETLESDGISPLALFPVKKFLGAARNVEEGGSLTILGTALVETGTKTDDVIFGQLVGTETLEIKLDRLAAARRIWPALDVEKSSTLKEETLFEGKELTQVQALRKLLSKLTTADDPQGGLSYLLDGLAGQADTAKFLTAAAKKK